VVAEGATIGAGAVIGPGLRIGRFAMIGMGSVVTRPVGDFVLVAGNPATVMGAVCHHGEPLVRTVDGRLPDTDALHCGRCRRHYRIRDGAVTELVPAGRSR
jgi:UDP-2-acetamido-3-amino-2,3-dideoxy-glucuronate N-acetyltransferase